MKIAFIVPRLVNKGPIIVVRDLVTMLKDNVELIHVYHFGDESDIEFECQTYRIKLLTKINFDDYDIIHSHMLKPDLYVFLHGRYKNSRTKYISTLHQNIYDNLSNDYNKYVAFFIEEIWLKILKRFDVVVSLTNTLKKHYLERSPRLNICTIYNGRDIALQESLSVEDLNLIFEIKSKYKIIGCHCLLTKRKGVDQVVKSLKMLPNFSLIVVGDGKEKENLVKLAIEIGVSDRCYFLGFKSNAISILRFFDVYVMSSYSEGFPLALLEAGSVGIPVVCSNIEIFRELFSDEEVSYYELNNISSLSEAILNANNKSNHYSKNLKSTIISKYSCNKMARKYLELYKSIILD